MLQRAPCQPRSTPKTKRGRIRNSDLTFCPQEIQGMEKLNEIGNRQIQNEKHSDLMSLINQSANNRGN